MKPQDNMRLLIIGDGPEKEPLEQLAQQLGITDTVVFTGKVLHPDLPPYVHTCDIYVTASLSDTNSISMLEGMAGGLPVLQLYDELNADQVTDGVNGYMFRDAAEMGQRLRQIRDMEPEELQKLKNLGHPVGQNSLRRTDPCQLHPDHLLQHLSKTATQKAAAVPPAFLPHCTCPSQVSFLYQSKQKDASDFGRSVFLLSSSFSVILLKKPSFLSPVFTITT